MEVRLCIVVNLFMDTYVQEVVESRLAPMKSIDCIGMRIDFSMLSQMPKEWKKDKASLVTNCTLRKEQSLRS